MRLRRQIIAVCLLAVWLAPSARAVKIADITRLAGERSNTLTGLGLVVGLKGSGDGGAFLPAIKPLAAMLAKFSNPATVQELSAANNVAIVMLTVTLPERGVRDGDRLDVYVTSIGAAKSLEGGRLFISPLQGPIAGSGIFAMAEGQVTIENPKFTTNGIVKRGAVMEADLPSRVIENGRITLILNDPAANWTTASAIARIINDSEASGEVPLATAVDAKNIVVVIPPGERERPDSFISRVRLLPVQILQSEARVRINERTGTIIMTGDVEISPVVISHKGLTISTVNPAPAPSPRAPITTEKSAIALDTTRQGGAKLQELVDAMDLIKVAAEDRVIIVKELHKLGYLHAQLILE
jgi:flagellar P-ring protein FlgI